MDKATRFVREGRWLEAIALYRTITQKAPRKPEPHFNLARLYQKLGHLGLAISEYKKITELKDELGDNQAYVVESERAIEDLSKLLKNCIHP